MEQVTLEAIPQVQVAPVQTRRRQRIGLYGGTFNPVHTAHLMVADQVGHALRLNRVDFLPDAVPPHVDKKTAIDATDRVAMLRLAIQDNPLFGLELAEIQRGGASYTYETVKQLKEAHPENDYYFIIGGDMVDYLPKWYRINDLLKIVNFVAVRRPGAKNESQYPVIWVDVPEVQIASSDIRQRVAQGESIRYLVPTRVEQYIKEHDLYHGRN